MTLVSSDSPSPMMTVGRELAGNLTTDGSQKIYFVQQRVIVWQYPSALERPQSFFPLHQMTINKYKYKYHTLF